MSAVAPAMADDTRPARARRRPDELPTGAIPWHVGDLKRLLFALVIATIGLVGSWLGVSGTLAYSRQELWIAAGIGSVAVGGLGIMNWLLAGFRMVRVRQSRLLAETIETYAGAAPADLATQKAVIEDALVTAPGMTLFHRSSCQLVRGKSTRPITAVTRRSLHACQVCLPVSNLAAPQ